MFTTDRDRVAATARTGIVAGAQAIQIIVTVLLVATSAAVFVVAIGVFVALTLDKFGRLSRSPDHTSQSAREKRPPRDFEISK